MSRIEQLISDIEAYIDECKFQPFSSTKIIVDKDQLEDMLAELRLKTPDEIKKYKKIVANQESIINEAKEQAQAILNAAQIQTQNLVNEHEIMQRAYAQANKLIDDATEIAQKKIDDAVTETNEMRMAAVEYTDQMLSQLQYIIEHSIKDNRERTASLMGGLEDILNVVVNNRKELNGEDEEEIEESEDELADNVASPELEQAISEEDSDN